MGTDGGGNSDARKRAEDVYALVQDLGTDLAKVTAVMVSAGTRVPEASLVAVLAALAVMAAT